MNRLGTFLSSHILLLVVLPAAVSFSHCDFPAIINLGDSNSDTGSLSATFFPLTWPQGMTYFGTPAGRFSDGRLIIDFIAESLGHPFLSAYLDSLGANFSHGANFASGGAGITYTEYSNFPLGVQLSQLLQFSNRSQVLSMKGGVFAGLLPKTDYLPRALYTLDIGHNDVQVAYISRKAPEEFIPKSMDGFSNTVKSIYDEVGGRSFWVHNTGPLGCFPYYLLTEPVTESQLDSFGCAIPLNNLVQQFNKMLKQTVATLRKDLPLASITYVDVYSAKYSLFKNAEKNGFEQTFAACCGYGGGKYNINPAMLCFQPPVMVNGTLEHVTACKDPSKQISWDGIHYTEAGNKYVFDKISGGDFSDPPVSLKMACQRNASSMLSNLSNPCPLNSFKFLSYFWLGFTSLFHAK